MIHKHVKRRPEVSKMAWTLKSDNISGGEGRLTFYLLDPHFPGDEQDRDIVENTVNLFQELWDHKQTVASFTSLI